MFGNLCFSLLSETKTLENIIRKILDVNPLGCFFFLSYQRLGSENSDLHKIYRIFNSIKKSKPQAIRIAGNYHVLPKSVITWEWSVYECNSSLVESLRFYIKKSSVWQGKITPFQVIIILWKSRDTYVVVCWNRELVCFLLILFPNICDIHTDSRTAAYLKTIIENIVTTILKGGIHVIMYIVIYSVNVRRIMRYPVISRCFIRELV